MADDYYSLPLRCDLLIQGAAARQPGNARQLYGSLDESIHEHVYLLITTPFRSVRFDPDYGCEVWEGDFSSVNDSNDTRWTDQVQHSILKAIRTYEPRLERIDVLVELDREGGDNAHKRLVVTVTAEIRKSSHRMFRFRRVILIAPFAASNR
ncbi:GPW/gp25 family protein [uncultured Spirosoma sp.]|uniref:GPW/gp25 family protein n=1 Tax=uncultured Spirosoma sp. TaxID=278208 RepID=UPI0025887307|nr:GPW/gp25 family protein [uncultured Spirosoma sp.]